MTNPHDPHDPHTPHEPIDAVSKQRALDAAMQFARVELLLETLDTRGRDELDIHEIGVWSVRDLVRGVFDRAYREGLHAGYRQGRTDACREARGEPAPSAPRDPELPNHRNT